IANEFLHLFHRPDFEQIFAAGLELYDGLPWILMSSVVADHELGTVMAEKVCSAINPTTMQLDERFATIETGKSFGGFCKALGVDEPQYWLAVYERVGLDTKDARSGNEPVFP